MKNFPARKQEDDPKFAEILSAALLLAVEPRLRTAVLNAIAVARATAGAVEEIAEAIRTGRIEQLIDRMARAGALSLADDYAAVYTAAGRQTAQDLSDGLLVTVSFDQVNERAVEQMQRNRLNLIRDFMEEQKEVARAALTRGVTAGVNPLEQARELRGDIGLTFRQQQTVNNYRRSLEAASQGDRVSLERELRDRRFDPTIQRAINTGEPLTTAQIDRMVQRYKERMLRLRSETIARTEALRAVHSAQNESLLQAVEEGVVNAGTLVREWNATRDERTRDSHQRLNGMLRGLNQTFPGLAGPLRFPGDPLAHVSEVVNCRCNLGVRVQLSEDI